MLTHQLVRLPGTCAVLAPCSSTPFPSAPFSFPLPPRCPVPYLVHAVHLALLLLTVAQHHHVPCHNVHLHSDGISMHGATSRPWCSLEMRLQ